MHAVAEVARHGQRRGRRERAVDPAHLRGIIVGDAVAWWREAVPPPDADLLRPLAEYEQAAGGAWRAASWHPCRRCWGGCS